MGSIETKSLVWRIVAEPPRLMAPAGVGAAAGVAAATTGGAVAWFGTIGAIVAAGPPLAGADGDGRHATNKPSPPTPAARIRNERRDIPDPELIIILIDKTPLLSLPACQARIERASQAVSYKVECQYGQENRGSRRHADPRRHFQVLRAGANHCSPT